MSDAREHRVLVLAPAGRDAALACAMITEAGLAAEVCASGAALAEAIEAGAGTVLLTEEAAEAEGLVSVRRVLGSQPTWSALPVLVLTSTDPGGAAGRELAERVTPLGNVTVLERPMHRAMLLSAVRAALRARARQYQVRDLLARHEQGLRTRDEFLAMLGHELRNPLAAITNSLNATDLAHESGSANVAALRDRERALIARQVRHLARMVDDLLDVSRVTSGKIALRHEPVDLGDLVLRCVQAVEDAARLHGLELRVSAARGAAVVTGDPTRLDQAVTNLLANAVKYTPPGGQIDVDVKRVGTQAVVSVRDTGVGLAPEATDKVFDLFVQANRTLDRTQGGLGIGLTLVRALARLHGGDAVAASDGLGRGATFELRLPLSAAGVGGAPSAKKRPPARAAGRPHRVLVVEDNVDNRESMVLVLQQLGHEAEEAADGEEALAKLRRRPPDVALVDIGLPGLDGYEVARRVRAGGGPGVYLVAVTGYGQSEDKARARDAGFDAHLTKPVDLGVLKAVLAQRAVSR